VEVVTGVVEVDVEAACVAFTAKVVVNASEAEVHSLAAFSKVLLVLLVALSRHVKDALLLFCQVALEPGWRLTKLKSKVVVVLIVVVAAVEVVVVTGIDVLVAA